MKAEPEPRQLGSIAERAPMARTERLDVYAEGYYSRLLEALQTDYPILAAKLGEDAFMRLTAEYLAEHPSRSYDLNELGRELPSFLAAWDELDEFPWAADLASLERAKTEVFFARDPEGWSIDALRSLNQSELEALCFEGGTAARLLELQWAVDTVDATTSATMAAAAIAREARTVLVFRRGFNPAVERLGSLQRLALTEAQRGRSIAEICGRLAEEASRLGPEAESEAAQLFSWFAAWGAHGVLRPKGASRTETGK